jgi:hypothetical protein
MCALRTLEVYVYYSGRGCVTMVEREYYRGSVCIIKECAYNSERGCGSQCKNVCVLQ